MSEIHGSYDMGPSVLSPENVAPKTAEVQDLERILRGEISAVEAYKQVLEKYSTYENANSLRRILVEHEKAVDFWKKQLRSQESFVEESSGPWGTVVETFVGAAKLFGDGPTLRALKEGEEHGLNEYQDLIENGNVNFESESFIKTICLDQQRLHIATLDSLIMMNKV
ncbi:DUF2383 domain-containing protein [Pseudobdellovibrio exovorus]|uniref:DUF2383 domain-containing protein n=1 Tax=Pseudobdellovibrio exovorus JSS TaxID=1184267 RepID=M4V8U0_9BACT|nr:DUF2383 domain-containing protein [Pseudobdellovibrio exovorus]AGH94865.1 hypothetical protein A11Q_645 [Pseudobdellovibrio exovorus JSS]